MFYLKTTLKESASHGIGLFAEQDIPKGAIIWTPSPALTLHFTQQEFSDLPPEEKKVIEHYGYLHKEFNVWHLAADDSRFVNHSETPTTTVTADGWGLQALVDIKKGDELTQNYRDFEGEESLRKRGLIR